MANSKVATFLGFCVKSGKILLGYDAIERNKKKIYLLVADESLSPNTVKRAVKVSEQFGCPLLICHEDLGATLHKQGCKLVAIQDQNLANAIIGCADSHYENYSGGNL